MRKLNVWSASSQGSPDGPGAIPCRPYVVLINNLYPSGQPVTRALATKPDLFPSGREILQRLLAAMKDPPDKGVPQHRPGKVSNGWSAVSGCWPAVSGGWPAVSGCWPGG